jgi:hypothetical protein
MNLDPRPSVPAEGRSRATPSFLALLVGLLLPAIAPSAGLSQSQTDGLLHGSFVHYQDSEVKDRGLVLGAYGTWGKDYRHLVEFGGAWTRIDFKDVDDLDQIDGAAAYNFYASRGSLRAGAHFISATDALTDHGFVLFGGGSLYEFERWSLGVDGAWSRYPNYDRGLSVGQIAPTAGFTIKSDDRRYVLGVTARAYFIRLSRGVGQNHRQFNSGELSASLTAGRLTLGGYGWAGEQAFAVRQGGFTVFNLSELHKGGFGGSIRWVTSLKTAVSAGYYFEFFEDLGISGTASAQTFLASFGFTF